MEVKTKIFDMADHLTTDEDIKLYWEAIVEDVLDDPELILAALGDVARATTNMSQLSRELNVSRVSLYKGFTTDGNPSFITVVKLIKALGLSFSTTRVDKYNYSDSTKLQRKQPTVIRLVHMQRQESASKTWEAA